CGRDNIRLNTQCYSLFNNIHRIESLAGFTNNRRTGKKVDELWKDLVFLWGSDFRTYTTDDKYLLFRNKMGKSLGESNEILDRLAGQIEVKKDFALFNPGNSPWEGLPFTIVARFPPGKMKGQPLRVLLDGKAVTTQECEVELYRDGYIRKAKLLVKPYLEALSLAQGEIVQDKRVTGNTGGVAVGNNFVETPSVKVFFSEFRGGAIKELFFPRVSKDCLVRTLPHGYFNDIRMAADFYSANVIALSRVSNEQITDLNRTKLIFPENPDAFPISIPVSCSIETSFGKLWKTYYVSRDEPRLDIRYHFHLKDFRPHSFRLGMLTINPEAFNIDSLRYSTVNGGSSVETFYLKGKKVLHHEPVSLSVSAHSCLGATEGWVDISDDEKGVSVISEKSRLYSVPLIHFEEVDNTYFLRVYSSIGEADDTSNSF
ncbi:MAG: hypothetical protein U1D67_05880, partial [Dehalococcoidia bacterium]|nr:hypothetical protein [Dehalococcoidia bacterium]